MKNLKRIKLSECPDWMERASVWFHEKWVVPKEAYLESMEQGLHGAGGIPQWYLVLDASNAIIAGAGIIENDFHARKDLTPNLCALYVERAYRGQGIARHLLDICRTETGRLGFSQLYLITDHTAFYEKCGWTFLTMVDCDGDEQARMYAADTQSVSE